MQADKMQNFILTSIIDIMATSHKCQDKRNLAKYIMTLTTPRFAHKI